MKKIFILFFLFSLTRFERVKHYCPLGQFWSGQSCLKCMTQYCTCSFINTCDNVECGLAQVSNGQACEDCPIGCSECKIGNGNQDYICTACDDGYQLIENICFSKSWAINQTLENNVFQNIVGNENFTPPAYIFRNLQPCEQFDEQDSLCEKCPENAFQNEYGLCEGCIDNCQKCTARGTCNECQKGYYWNTNAYQITDSSDDLSHGSGGCSKCNDTLAITCSDDGLTSISCVTNSFLYKKNNTSKCIPCLVGCKKCSSIDSCDECMEKWYKNKNKCILCTEYCVKCSGQLCDECQDDYFEVDGQCKKCNIALPGCSKCKTINSGRQTSQLTCEECDNKYYPKTIGNINSCQKCSDINPAWLYCENPTQPTQCIGGFNNFTALYLLVESVNDKNILTCVKNELNCMSMSPLPETLKPSCAICIENQILLPDGSCENCPEGCTSCNVNSDNQVICALCMSGYIFTNQKCKQCPEGCQECSVDNFCKVCQSQYTLKNGVCFQCSANCEICLPDLTCVQCMSEFFSFKDEQSKQVCLPCPPGCLDCQSTTGRTCQKCKPNYFPQGSGCSNGTDYCAVYKPDGFCEKCKYGARVSNGRCQRCIDPVGGYVCGQNAGFTECNSNIFQIFVVFLIFLSSEI